jgi:hypothetical protein
MPHLPEPGFHSRIELFTDLFNVCGVLEFDCRPVADKNVLRNILRGVGWSFVFVRFF